MNKKTFTGLKGGFSILLYALRPSLFALSAMLLALRSLLLAFFTLLFALSSPLVAEAADKLVVKDTGGTTNTFVVDDNGSFTAAGNLKWDSPNKRLGLNTSNPQASIHMVETTTSATRGLLSAQHNNGAQAAYTLFRKSRGSDTVPTAVAPGDFVGFMDNQGYDGSAYQNAGSCGFMVDGSVSSGTVPMAFLVYTGSSIGAGRAERIRITSSGNVGIGTTSPQGKLDVNGAIYQRGSELHADYVFEPAYKMESIEEHARYMWENKHLSAVPGVRRDENGLEIVEVGSHQRGILEELEKAHVYIEQLNEKIKALETKLEELKANK